MKVLFIGHDATRSGAPILFLNLLKWIKRNSSIPFEILLKEGGELKRDFGSLAECQIFKKQTEKTSLWPFRRSEAQILQKYRNEKISLIYSNTITNGDLLERLSYLTSPVITHVHELENYIHHCGEDNFSKVKKHTTLFIVASNAVKDILVKNHQIHEERIQVVHAFIPTENFVTSLVSRSRANVLRELAIPENAFVVGGSGTTDWRKSPELFVQMAGYTKKNFPEYPVYFLWVGGSLSWELQYDIDKMMLDNIRFVRHTAKTREYFNCMDVFALVSRIDPYPLVCLEAASLGKPVICFDRAGGMPEFVESDSVFIVPYLDIREMVEKILCLYHDQDLRLRLGKAAQNKVRERHDVNVAGNQILDIIKQFAIIDNKSNL